MLATSGISKPRPSFSISRISLALAPASAWAARAWVSWVESSASCWAASGWLVVPPLPISPLRARNASTFPSASATRLRRVSMFVPSQVEA